MHRLLLAGAILASLTGCNFANEQERMRNELTLASIELSGLKERVQALEKFALVSGQASQLTPSPLAEFDPAADTGFQLVQTAVTPVLVMFKDVEPLADGSRVRLQIGNVSAAGLENADLKITYRARAGGELLAVEQSVLKSMSPGAWTEVQASLPSVRPGDLGYVGVEVRLSVVSLRSAR